eukprot:jgi/Mesen1/2815/ME000172S01971
MEMEHSDWLTFNAEAAAEKDGGAAAPNVAKSRRLSQLFRRRSWAGDRNATVQPVNADEAQCSVSGAEASSRRRSGIFKAFRRVEKLQDNVVDPAAASDDTVAAVAAAPVSAPAAPASKMFPDWKGLKGKESQDAKIKKGKKQGLAPPASELFTSDEDAAKQSERWLESQFGQGMDAMWEKAEIQDSEEEDLPSPPEKPKLFRRHRRASVDIGQLDDSRHSRGTPSWGGSEDQLKAIASIIESSTSSVVSACSSSCSTPSRPPLTPSRPPVGTPPAIRAIDMSLFPGPPPKKSSSTWSARRWIPRPFKKSSKSASAPATVPASPLLSPAPSFRIASPATPTASS